MAIDLATTYPGKTYPPSGDYPEGSVKNETVPNSSNDGTPLDEKWGNDFEGMKQAILRAGGITPTAPGNIPDTALLSQIMQGVIELIQGRAINFNDVGIADAYELNVRTNQQPPAGLFDTQIFGFFAGNSSTGVSTLNLETLITGAGTKVIKTKDGNDTSANTIIAGKYYQVRYDLANDWVEIVEFGDGGQLLGIAPVKAIFYNAQTIGEDITIEATNNAMSAGPISIDTGFSVTVETGARWVIN